MPSLMKFHFNSKTGSLLILPLLFLMVQFCTALPHFHKIKSWHDDDDVGHHLYSVDQNKIKTRSTKFNYTPDSPTRLSASFRASAPLLDACINREPLISVFHPNLSTDLFLKRAPPA